MQRPAVQGSVRTMMLRPYLPDWLKDERAEFVLEIVSALTLAAVALWWWV
jgi:hypothetical protein